MSRFMAQGIEQATQFLVDRSRRPSHRHHQVLAIFLGATMELVIVPLVLVVVGTRIDRMVGLGSFVSARLSRSLAACCFALGVPWLAWSIYWQHRYGKGTPLPLVPTKVFLSDGPYRYTRNPMNLGALWWLAGWAWLANSSAALFGGVGLFAGIVLTYIKVIEERELERRFGAAYTAYRQRTPFLIPWRSRRA